jgi:hypothetical protein
MGAGARQQNKIKFYLSDWVLQMLQEKSGNSKQEIPMCFTESVFFELQEFS